VVHNQEVNYTLITVKLTAKIHLPNLRSHAKHGLEGFGEEARG